MCKNSKFSRKLIRYNHVVIIIFVFESPLDDSPDGMFNKFHLKSSTLLLIKYIVTYDCLGSPINLHTIMKKKNAKYLRFICDPSKCQRNSKEKRPTLYSLVFIRIALRNSKVQTLHYSPNKSKTLYQYPLFRSYRSECIQYSQNFVYCIQLCDNLQVFFYSYAFYDDYCKYQWHSINTVP